MTRAPETEDTVELASLREALNTSRSADRSKSVDFLVAAAWLTSLRFNLGGWVLRGAVLVGCFACATTIAVTSMVLCLVPLLGWALAGLELLRSDMVTATAERAGWPGRLAVHLSRSRGRAMATASGLLENFGAVALLIGFYAPWTDSNPAAQGIGIVLTSAYGAVAAAQVMTDAGYFNLEPGLEPATWKRVFRQLLPGLYLAAVIVVIMLATDSGRAWALTAVTALFVAVHVIGAVTDNALSAATSSYLSAAEQEGVTLAAQLSEEVHRIGLFLDEQAQDSDDPKIRRAYALAFAEVDAVRKRASQRQLDSPPDLDSLLDLLGRKDGTGLRTHCDDPTRRLSHAGTTTLRHIVLDLFANALDAGARTITANVSVSEAAWPRVWITIVVEDDGPGFSDEGVMHDFAPGSSRASLHAICSASPGRKGGLTYARTGGLTRATAKFRTDTWTGTPPS